MFGVKIPEILSRQDYLRLPPREREIYVREVLRRVLALNSSGVTIGELSKVLPFDRRTMEKHFSILIYTNEAYGVNIGPTTQYHSNRKTIHPILQKTIELNGLEYSTIVLENRFGQFVFIQERKKMSYTEDTGGGILVPLEGFGRFVKHLQSLLDEIPSEGA